MTVRIWVNPRTVSNLNCLFLSLTEMQSSSNKEHNKSLRLVLFFPFHCCFAGSLPFSLSTVKQMKLFHSISEMFFTFLMRKTLWVNLSSLNVCEAALQAAIKGGNFCETHTPLWLLIGCIVFLTHEKTSFAILIGHITFFTCENHCLFLWLARTNLCMKDYDIAFWWVFLSMYIIKPCTAMYRHVLPCIATYSYVLPCIAMYCHVEQYITMHCPVLPCIAMYCHL